MPVIRVTPATEALRTQQAFGQRATAEDFGGDQGLSQLASAAGTLGGRMREIDKRRQSVEMAKALSKLQVDFVAEQRRLTDEFGYSEDYVDRVATRFNERASTIQPGALVRDKFDLELTKLRDAVIGEAELTQLDLAAKQTKAEFADIITNLENTVRLNPSALDVSTSTLEAASSELPAGVREAINSEAKAQLRVAQANGIADAAPARFLQQYRNGEFKDVPNVANIAKRAEADVERAKSKASQHIRRQLRDLETAASSGVVVSDKRLATLEREASAIGDKEGAEAVREFASIQSKLVSFSDMGFESQKDKIAELRERVGTGGEIELASELRAYQNAYQHKATSVSKDPWSYYARTNVVDEIEPLDFSNDTALKHNLSVRRAGISDVMKRDGVRMPILTNTEIEQLRTSFRNEPPEAVAAKLEMLGDVLDPSERAFLSRQFKGDDDVLAAAMSVDMRTAMKLIQGDRIDSVGTSKASVDAAFNGVVSEFARHLDPSTMNALRTSVYAMFKQDLTVKGAIAETLDDETLTENVSSIVDQLMGERAEVALSRPTIGGQSLGRLFAPKSEVFLFKKSDGQTVSTDELEDFVMGLSEERLIQMGGGQPEAMNGDLISADILLSQARMVTSGDGRYQFLLKAGNSEGLVMYTHEETRADGKVVRSMRPFELNLKEQF